MAGGAGGQAARSIAVAVERQRLGSIGGRRGQGEGGIMERHRLALVAAQPLSDPAHLEMRPAAVGIGLELALEIAGIEPGQPRRAGAVAAPVEAVAGEAGVARPGPGAAHGDDPAVLGEAIERARLGGGAAGEQGGGEGRKQAHGAATVRWRRWFLIAALAPSLVQLAACKPPPDERHYMPGADAANGKAAIERAGCASCHTIPGISWPRGKVAPHLEGLTHRALIAGRLPNRPDLLAAFLRDAPSLVPGTAMPAMPVSEAEARDIAAFLYQQGAR
jgi:cytochrome c2